MLPELEAPALAAAGWLVMVTAVIATPRAFKSRTKEAELTYALRLFDPATSDDASATLMLELTEIKALR